MPLGHAVDDLFAEMGFTPAQARASVQQQAQEQWDAARTSYQQDPHNFYTCWHYLSHHPIFQEHDLGSMFAHELHIMVTKVNPTTREIDDDESKNTQTEVWLEHGPIWRKDDAPPGFWTDDLDQHCPFGYTHTHDPDLDCGADTFERAITILAHLVHEQFGDDRSKVYLSSDPQDEDEEEDDEDDEDEEEDDEEEEDEE